MAVDLTPNMEMYLKTIFEIIDSGDPPRIKVIADRLGVTMPSVSGAVETLHKRGFVGHSPYGKVALTKEGRKVARKVIERNNLIYRFLKEVLGLPEATAQKDACTLEHVVSRNTLGRFSQFLEFLEVCPLGPGQMMDHFVTWAINMEKGGNCARCVEEGGVPQCDKRING